MYSCDVLIVGGGPAGSSCAWGLRNSQLEVAVLDQRMFPRDKVCGGWITPGVLRELNIDTFEYAQGRMLQPITGFKIGCIDGRALDAAFGTPVSYGIRRREFDDYLLRRSGARFLLGTPLASFERNAEGWIVNHEIHARMLVGAGGHFCPVARRLRTTKITEPAVVAQEAEFEMTPGQIAGCQVRGESPELYFCSDLKGYGWCFRKGDILNIGLGRADPHRLSTHVAAFLQFLKATGRISFDVPPMHGHAYLLNGTSTRTVAAEGVLLIGDSAGLAYPQSGEGIRPAIESGLLAAKTILGAKGDYDTQSLDSYRSLLTARAQPWTMNIGRYLPSRWIGYLGRRLLNTRWFVRDVVLKQWFLHEGSIGA